MEWFRYLYRLKLLPGVYPSTAEQEAICIGSWPNLAKTCISYRGNGKFMILNRNCIDILCMPYCHTRGFLTTSFVIGIAAVDYYGLWMGLPSPNSDFMEISRGFRKTHTKETCQQFPSASHEQLHLFAMMKTRCGVKQGLWKCWFRLQNEIKTRWGGLQKRGRFRTRLKRGHSWWKRGHSWWKSAETWKTRLKRGRGTPSIFFTAATS